jgi:hypothetical protein
MPAAILRAFTGLAAESILDSSPEETLPWLAEVLASWLKSEKTDVHRLVPRIFSNASRLAGWLVDPHGTNRSLSNCSLRARPHRYPSTGCSYPCSIRPATASRWRLTMPALIAGIQEASGLARVMLYRFHEDFSGEVIAERAAPGLGSYLGLRFPASDIPAIARRLYLINPWRGHSGYPCCNLTDHRRRHAGPDPLATAQRFAGASQIS